jgi:peptidyl-tRNA hydrolase
MPEIINHHDLDAAALQRYAQEDPWVMYLVVRKDVELPGEAVLRATVQAVLGCVEEFYDDPRYAEAFQSWFERSFRKVALVADEKQWARLQAEFDCAVARNRGTAVVACLPPQLKSAQGPVLKRMQSLKGELSGSEQAEDIYAVPFVFNEAVEMSLGKAVAQVGHATLMLARSSLAKDPRYAERLERWRLHPGATFLCANAEQWAELKQALDCVVVRDAGLTEVSSGSETVLAAPPPLWGPLPEPFSGLKPLPALEPPA